MEQFLFPPELPLTLHLCPDKERDRWMAECDMDPKSKAKVVVCSLHFKDGYPTAENPFPTELLGEGSGGDSLVFRGKRPTSGGSFYMGEWANREARKYSGEILELVMNAVDENIDAIEAHRELELRKSKEKEERRRKEKRKKEKKKKRKR